ncbi:MAG: GNAT family N-acetyltransferase [Lachnospiraceae bacterium]|nr:GNAT family N-acetyltransferase [Lachnospiraceae bacterium]
MVELRELRETDAEKMIEWMLDPQIKRSFLKEMSKYTLEDARQFCREAIMAKDSCHNGNIHMAIVNEDDEYLGTISLKNIDRINQSAEFAIALREKARGKGIGVKASERLLDIGFGEMGLHRIYLTVFADNEAAIRLYEKIGFTMEGELREHIYRDGEYVSWRIYGILDNEYKRIC